MNPSASFAGSSENSVSRAIALSPGCADTPDRRRCASWLWTGPGRLAAGARDGSRSGGSASVGAGSRLALRRGVRHRDRLLVGAGVGEGDRAVRQVLLDEAAGALRRRRGGYRWGGRDRGAADRTHRAVHDRARIPAIPAVPAPPAVRLIAAPPVGVTIAPIVVAEVVGAGMPGAVVAAEAAPGGSSGGRERGRRERRGGGEREQCEAGFADRHGRSPSRFGFGFRSS